MDSQQENTKRIAKNTLMLYVRMLFGMLVSLYTSRIVLQALGVEDYGIYNVVGGFVSMFSMVSSSLSSAVSRFLTFELGRSDMEQLKKVFSTSLCIHLVLAAIILLLAESIGVWFLNTHMTIPAERIYAANWVFQASLVAFMFGLFSVPYHASIVAHERMTAFAYIGILDIILRLCIVLFIAYAPFRFDRLIVYSLLLVAVGISMQAIYWNYCRRHFEECCFRLNFYKIVGGHEFIRRMEFYWLYGRTFEGSRSECVVEFVYWAYSERARGIANTVNNVLFSFAGNFMTALKPQITKSYAAGNYDYMFSLVERGSRYSYYILLLFTLPMLFETEFILTLWLKDYPEHTVNFVRLALLITMCDILSNTLINLQLATGKIRNYQLAVGGTLMMNFPLSYICLKMNFPPESVLFVALVVAVCCLLLRLLFLRKMVGLSMRRYLYNVCGNVVVVTVVALLVPAVVYMQMPNNVARFFTICLLSVICTMVSIYLIGCTAHERSFIREKAISVHTKLYKKIDIN